MNKYGRYRSQSNEARRERKFRNELLYSRTTPFPIAAGRKIRWETFLGDLRCR